MTRCSGPCQSAASAPWASATTALQALRDRGQVREGQQVLIQGASGGVGTFAVQLAKVFGATITAVCSESNLELIRSLGADSVIDYRRDDFIKSGKRYDLILAVNGARSIVDYWRALRPGGRLVVIGGSGGQFFQALLLGPSPL